MSIKRQVMQVIEARIKEAQVACDLEVKILKENKWENINRSLNELCARIKAIVENYRSDKAEVEARHVNSILSKVL